MFVSSSRDGTEKAIDKYHDATGNSGSSSSFSHSSSGGSSTDEGYTSSVPEFPLEEGLGIPGWYLIQSPFV